MFAKAQHEGEREREELMMGRGRRGVVGDIDFDEVERGVVDGETSMESAVEVGFSFKNLDFNDYGG